MTPTLPDPSGLLWAFRLKKENGYLQERMNALETASEARISKVHLSSTEVADLAKRVDAIDEQAVDRRLATVETELEDVQAETKSMALQISSLTKGEEAAEAARTKALELQEVFLRRVGDVEQNLRNYEGKLGQVGKPVNEGQLSEIKARLEALTNQVRHEGEGMRYFHESLSALERAKAELVKANQRLTEDVQRLSERRERLSGSEREALAGADSEPPDAAAAAKKKHKWAGGGADRDIIQQGAAAGGLTSWPTRKPSTPLNASLSANTGRYRSAAATPKRPEMGSEHSASKSHKWAGGGAEKDILRQGADLFRKATVKKPARKSLPTKLAAWSAWGIKQELVDEPVKKAARADTKRAKVPARAAGKPTKATAQAAKQESSIFVGDERKAIIRSGKGWVEYAYTPTPEELSQEAEAPAKRPRGRPRVSEPSQDSPAVLLLGTQQRVTRGQRQQLDTLHAGLGDKKRKRDDDDEAPHDLGRMQPSKSATGLKSAPEKRHVSPKTSREPGIFDYPVSSRASSRHSPARHRTRDVVPGAFTLKTESQGEEDQPAPKKRRVIEQPDDSGLLEIYRGL